MRLTEKDYCGFDIKNREDFNGYDNEKDSQKLFSCLQKLGQLEDIEEELGIDLLTLFKALKNGIWVKYDANFGFTSKQEIVIEKDKCTEICLRKKKNGGYKRMIFCSKTMAKLGHCRRRNYYEKGKRI